MKNKKIIAFVCALSMIFSVFSALTVSADNAKGIDLSATLDKETGKTLTIVATEKGTTKKLNNFNIAFAVPSGVTTDDVDAKSDYAALTTNVADGVAYVAFNDSTGKGIEFTSGTLATIVISLSKALTTDFDITLTNDSMITDENGGAKVGRGNMDATTVTVTGWEDPNAKPKPAVTAAPTPFPEATPGTDPTPVPVTSNKGIALSASINEDNDEITVVATEVGTTKKLNNFNIAFAVPAGVTTDDVDAKSDYAALTTNVADGVAYVAFNDSTGKGIEFTSGTLATIVISLSDSLTEAFPITLTNDSMITDENGGAKVGRGNMTATSAVVTPYETPKTVVKTVPLADKMGEDKTNNLTAAQAVEEKLKEDPTAQIVITVDVKKTEDDGTVKDAVYGDDFEVFYGNSETPLTEKEYNDLIHGVTDEVNGQKVTAADLINNLNYKIYNDKIDTIKTSLQAVGDDTQLVNPGESEVTYTEPKPTDKPATPKAPAWSGIAPKNAEGGDTVTVTAKLAKNAYKDGKFVISVDNLAPVSGAGITVLAKNVVATAAQAQATSKKTDNDKELVLAGATKSVEFTDENDNDTVTVEVSFVAVASKKEKQELTLTYAYVDENGDPVVSEKDSVKTQLITIKKDSDSSSSSSSSSTSTSSGGNVIASGNQGALNNGNGVIGGFTDLNDAPWAASAVATLAAKNIVSGRGNGIFDPNANITRAEYCQILINAIGKSSEYADASFNDVPTDAWFYHAVAVASNYGIVSGYGDGNFGPYDLITREQMALMTQKAAQVMNVNLAATTSQNFTDDADIANWSRAAVYELANAGIINGMGDGTFAPRANATRAQAAVIIYNTFVVE